MEEKNLEFRGTSYDDLCDFPDDARRDAGYELGEVQQGRDPIHWKPMEIIGSGVREIIIKDDGNAFRVIYVAKFEDAIYVLHCFPKKTQKTSKEDIGIAEKRYRDLVKELNDEQAKIRKRMGRNRGHAGSSGEHEGALATDD